MGFKQNNNFVSLRMNKIQAIAKQRICHQLIQGRDKSLREGDHIRFVQIKTGQSKIAGYKF